MPPDIPPEIQLHVVAELPLKDLIRALGVCKKWRTMILDESPANPIKPVRKGLLTLFLHVISTPTFEKDRKINGFGFQPFDREEYLAKATETYRDWRKQENKPDDPHLALPEDFTAFILEWPEKAIVDRLWPALSQISTFLHYVPRITSTPVVFQPQSETATQPDGSTVLMPLMHLQTLGMGWGTYILLESFDHTQANHPPLRAGEAFRMDAMVIDIYHRSDTSSESESHSHSHSNGHGNGPDSLASWPWLSFVRSSSETLFVTGLARSFGYESRAALVEDIQLEEPLLVTRSLQPTRGASIWNWMISLRHYCGCICS